jgi:hypothetical protein
LRSKLPLDDAFIVRQIHHKCGQPRRGNPEPEE